MKEKLMALMVKLGMAEKARKNELTSEDWKKVAESFKAEHGIDFETAMKESGEKKELNAEMISAAQTLLGEESNVETVSVQTPDLGKIAKDVKNELESVKKVKETLSAENEDLKTKVETLGKQVEKIAPVAEAAMNKDEMSKLIGGAHTATHVFGIKHDMYDRKNWWNNVTATRKPVAETLSKREKDEFKMEFDRYAESTAKHFRYLHENNMLAGLKSKDMSSVTWPTYTADYTTGYVTRRQDAVIAYIRSLPTVADLFPTRYGVQDKEEMHNSFLGDFSQAYQSGEVFKGAVSIEPMLAKVDRAMMKHQFSDLKELEKEHIGYLNRESNQPMKWSFIEWIMVSVAEKLIQEQNRRRIVGYAITPVAGTAGHSNYGSDGLLRFLERTEEDLRVLPFALGIYDSTTMLDYVASFIEQANNALPDLNGYRLGINQKHVPWYKAAYREKYGVQLDFKGAELKVPDFDFDSIVAIPNMDTNDFKMVLYKPGFLETNEQTPGEMLKFYMEQRLEALIAASWWNEGFNGSVIGRKYATKAALTASNYEYQFIFTNDACSTLDADATTCDASKNTVFKTAANTVATTITDITNKKEGRVYKIVCGSATNASKTAKAALFSNIDAWIPTAPDDYLKVTWNATTSKFVEVARLVTP